MLSWYSSVSRACQRVREDKESEAEIFCFYSVGVKSLSGLLETYLKILLLEDLSNKNACYTRRIAMRLFQDHLGKNSLHYVHRFQIIQWAYEYHQFLCQIWFAAFLLQRTRITPPFYDFSQYCCHNKIVSVFYCRPFNYVGIIKSQQIELVSADFLLWKSYQYLLSNLLSCGDCALWSWLHRYFFKLAISHFWTVVLYKNSKHEQRSFYCSSTAWRLWI